MRIFTLAQCLESFASERYRFAKHCSTRRNLTVCARCGVAFLRTYISHSIISRSIFSPPCYTPFPDRSIDRDERAKATRVVGQCRDSGIIRPSATLLTRSTCGIRTYVRRLGCSKFAPFDRSAVQCHLICTHDNPRHGRHATYVL